jgi:hypothetical protein
VGDLKSSLEGSYQYKDLKKSGVVPIDYRLNYDLDGKGK